MEANFPTQARESEPLLCVRGLSKRYVQRRWFSRETFLIQALDNVDLEIGPCSTFALVGESGAGKSTLARCLARLEEPTSGEIWYKGQNLLSLSDREALQIRRQIQLIFQDPTSALNPRLSAMEIVSEPLAILRHGTWEDRQTRALQLFEQVGLSRRWGNRSPLELSGGQRQRLALARALILEPKLLILDEALAGLDLSTQAQIVNLLLDLQASYSLTYLYISHDLSLVGHIADEVAVIHRGRIIEHAGTAELFCNPRHAYTQDLIASIPRLESSV
jgi:ABC-type glutathione transport system ATPase component